jgi:ABC-type lipoprotein export system ATPase subunit
MKQTAGSISVEGKHIVKDFRMGTTTKVFKDISIKVMRGEFVSIMMTHSPEAAKSSSRIITVQDGILV